MRKIAIALSKGGVGKTTTAINLAAGLVRAKQRVLVVDLDTQGQVAKALGLQPAQDSVEARDGIWLLAGGRGLSRLKRVIARKDYGGEQTLAEALAPLDGRYDVVLLDT